MAFHPSPLLLGVVSAGEQATRQLVVKAKKPFKVLAARCEDERFKCTVSDEQRPLHLIPVTFTADETPGKVSSKILIEADLASGEVFEVPVYVQVMSRKPDSPQ